MQTDKRRDFFTRSSIEQRGVHMLLNRKKRIGLAHRFPDASNEVHID